MLFRSLPAYRMPTGRSILMHMWEKAEDFIHKAFTVIFMASIIVWFLQNFNTQFYMVHSDESIIAEIGKITAPIFGPLGFGDWRMSTALITGITAKEVVTPPHPCDPGFQTALRWTRLLLKDSPVHREADPRCSGTVLP